MSATSRPVSQRVYAPDREFVLQGRRSQAKTAGPPGDLYLIIHILPNDTFEREGDDLHMDVPLDIFTAIAGGEVRISAMERPLTLTIPSRTNANQNFRIRGKGMPHLGGPINVATCLLASNWYCRTR